MNIEYRILMQDDLELYKTIRLELLKSHPTSFGSSHEEESKFNQSHWEKRLNNVNAITIGAFIDSKIIGICVVMKQPRLKMKHIAYLNSMYVREKYRRQGISKKMVEYALSLLEETDIEYLFLSVVSTNIAAINLYKELGFTEYGIDPKIIKYEGEYYDLLLMKKAL